MSPEQLSEHIAEDTLHTWLDHELSRRESETVAAHVQHCAECSALLNECREIRSTVTQLLGTFDSERARQPRTRVAEKSTRAKMFSGARVSGAPIISHIVAESRTTEFWPTARKFVPQAALALVFAGSASLLMVRGYHAVAGSINDVANTRLVGPVYSSAGTVTVTGVVTAVTGQPIRNVVIQVRGAKMEPTSIQTTADAKGRFVIRGVPRSATALEVRPPLGFDGRTHMVNFAKVNNPVVNIVLLAGVRRLDPVVVTTAQPSWSAPSTMCLSASEPYSPADPRMFEGLRGEVRQSGNFRMDVVDWPAKGRSVSAVFAAESGGTIVGRVAEKEADLRITLTRDGGVWRGSASETRNYKARWRRVEMRAGSCAM